MEKNNIYFLGAGGIGMSALARHFHNSGKNVAGYDKTPTELTNELSDDGIDIHYTDEIDEIPQEFKQKDDTLIIYTPAIPVSHKEFNYFKNNNFQLVKRAYTLGLISNQYKSIAISGTHGKTSTSTMTAFLLHNAHVKCSAFLGGISKNFSSNYLYSSSSEYVVVEADEYDRSFLHLKPYIAIVTAIDADHLDIYNSKDDIIDSFNQFLDQVEPNGSVILNDKIYDQVKIPKVKKVYSYSLDNSNSDFYATNKNIVNGLFHFNLQTPFGIMDDLVLGIPGNVNLENAIAAIAAALISGVSMDEIKSSLPQLNGVKRRFDILFNSDKAVYIDDYAHHPEEIKRFLESVKELFTGKSITGIFQPHLYSRTRDFADEFAESLSMLDKLYLLDIYPAREEPIEGVSSKLILNKVTCKKKSIVQMDQILGNISHDKNEVIVTIGAGNIDLLVDQIVNKLKGGDLEEI